MLRFSPGADKNLRTFHAYIITPHAVPAAVRPAPVSNIEGQIMPRTGHDKALHAPFTQRTTFMRTNVVDRKICPFNVEERNLPIVDLHGFRLPRRQLGNQGNGLKPLFHATPTPLLVRSTHSAARITFEAYTSTPALW